MSAFRVSFATIDALLTSASAAALTATIPADAPCGDGAPIVIDYANPEHCTDIGRMFLDANRDALAELYGPDSESAREAAYMVEQFNFVAMAPAPTPEQVIGAAHCLSYQCSGAELWAMSPAQWLLFQIESHAARKLCGGAYGIDSNPARGDEPESELAPIAEPAPADATRDSLLARMTAATQPESAPDGETATLDRPEPAPEPAPEPELVAAKARKAKPAPVPAPDPLPEPDSSSSHRIALADIIAANEANAARAAVRKARAAELKAVKYAAKAAAKG